MYLSRVYIIGTILAMLLIGCDERKPVVAPRHPDDKATEECVDRMKRGEDPDGQTGQTEIEYVREPNKDIPNMEKEEEMDYRDKINTALCDRSSKQVTRA